MSLSLFDTQLSYIFEGYHNERSPATDLDHFRVFPWGVP